MTTEERFNVSEEIMQIRERLASLESDTKAILRILEDDRSHREKTDDRIDRVDGRINWLWGALTVVGAMSLAAFGAWLRSVLGG